jgi:SAM-dependent methyltransferase
VADDYRDDLAWIHHVGFSEFAEAAATGVIAMLRRARILGGVIVDVGCGSGVAAREFLNAGFEVVGIDASPSMISLARLTAPEARFEVATFDGSTLPHSDAIVAIGEVLNYGTFAAMHTFLGNAAAALRGGGMLVFDVAERGAHPMRDERRVGGDDWSVIVVKESDGRSLTRRVLTFRQLDGVTRRHEEVHTLELYDRDELLSLLSQLAFRVRVRHSYGTRRLPKGHAVYVARRAAD